MAAQADAANTIKDIPQRIDVDLGMLTQRIDGWIDGAIRMLPNIVVALIVFALFYGVAALVRRTIRGQLSRHSRDNLGDVLGGFVRWSILLLGFLLAATIVLPSLKPGDLVAGLGVSSVAIGFAFKDILQNWLAGLLILFRQPFATGDQIVVGSHEGTVERIETRATLIRTYDGERIVIPNSDIYTSAVRVKTAFDKRRSQYDVGIGYGDGIENACRVIRDAVAGVPGVQGDPAPEALAWDLAASWVTIRARWWTEVRRADVVRVHSDVIIAIKKALDAAGIDLPYETRVHLFHDQTEAVDGIRGEQREGWPAPREGRTEPRWKAQAALRAEQARAAPAPVPALPAENGR